VAGARLTDALVVDWLGRGGITQCAEAWADELARDGHEVLLASRGGRELDDSALPTLLTAGRGPRLATHRRLVARTVRAIEELRPKTVVVQNYVVPLMEDVVHRAARRVGARLVVVVHDHRHHGRLAGNRVALTRQLRRADDLVAHSAFVAAAVARDHGRRPEVIPVPVMRPMLERPRPSAPVLPATEDLTAVHVGVLTRRANKGTDVAVALAEQGVAGWRFGFLGRGAPVVPGAATIDRFLDAGELVAALEAADAVLLPYRFASQSGVVVLAQALGCVPIATAVGGLPEQIDDGVTGLLLPGDASVAAWADALGSLDDRARLTHMAGAARAAVEEAHAVFAAAVRRLVG
jgi:glycosyltransferase involved in cell wall biosynthesis